MSGVTVKIEGLAQLEDAMLNGTVKHARTAMRSSLGDAGDFMRVKLALNAPSRTGFLARNMVEKIKLSVREDEGTVAVGPSRAAFYAQFVEFGSIHNIPPRPFISQTFRANSQIMAEYFARKLREELGL